MNTLFAYPWFLAGFGLLLVLALLSWRGRRLRRKALAGLGGGLKQPVPARPRGRRFRGACFGLGLVCLCVGAAGPQWGRDWEQAAAPGRDLIVVLDRSRSMLAERPSRLLRPRVALLEFVNFLKSRGGGHRLALVTFAAQPRLVCPLTHDYGHFRETVAAIDPELMDPELSAPGAVSGTRIGRALRLAVLAQAGPAGRPCNILLLSDGDDPARDGEWREGVAAARAAGVAVYTVGLGDPDDASPVPAGAAATEQSPSLEFEGAPVHSRLEESVLREIATATGGVYEPARRQTPPLGPLYLQMTAEEPGRDDGEDSLPVYRQHPEWFLTTALGLLCLATVLGEPRSAGKPT